MRVDAIFGERRRVEVERVGGAGVGPVLSTYVLHK